MRLRPLLITLAVLLPAAGAVWWLQRPAPPAQSTDARLGQRVADPAGLASATRVRLKAQGKTAELARTDDGRWTVAATDAAPALPADASRLTRLAADLVSPKVERLVTENPTRIATLELDATEVAFLDAAGKTLLELDLGKNADGGGRFLRYGSEAKAYLARLNASIDADPTNWRDSALVALKNDDIASIAFAFSGAAPVVVSRPDAKTGWTSPAAPAGQQVKATTVNTQLTNLTGLRYTQVAPNLDPGVIAARVLTRDVTLTTFDGRTVKISLGRAPEVPKPAKPATPPSADGSTPPSEPAEPPAPPRPVYLEINDSKPDAVLAAAAKTHAFEIGEWIHSGLPATSADLFEPVPAPPAPATPPAAPAPTETSASPAPAAAPVSVTTEPVTVTTEPMTAPPPPAP
jgi:hypothetical protein